jgi:hypothetical protein
MPRVREFRPAAVEEHGSPRFRVDWNPKKGLAGFNA